MHEIHSEVPSTLNIPVTYFLVISVFYCNVKNDHKQELKTTPIYKLTVLGVRRPGRLVWVLYLGSPKVEVKALVGGALVQRTSGKIPVLLIQTVGRIQFLAVVGLKSLFHG